MADCGDDDLVISRTTAFSDRLGQELETLHNERDFTDFKLVTGGKVVECHRVVIAMNSPVLKAMLKSQMKETTEKQIELNTISPHAMDNLVEYMYSGKTRIQKQNLKDVIEAADYLQMDGLKQLCTDQAPDVLEVNNVLSWFKLSDIMHLSELHSQCSQLITSQIDELKAGQEFLELQISELHNCLAKVKQNDADPDDLLGASLDWVNADPDNRRDEMEELLEAVPMEKCSLQCLKEELHKHKNLFDTNVVANRVITENLISVAENELGRKHRSSKPTYPIYLVVGDRLGKNNQCWYLESTSSLAEFCKIPNKHLHVNSSFCQTPQGFAITGGEDSDDAVMFNLSTKIWKKLPKLLVKRFAHGSVFVKGILFIFGGVINYYDSCSIHYLEKNESWQSGPDIPVTCDYPAVVSIGDDIFLLQTWSNQFYKMTVGSKTWSSMASPPGNQNRGATLIRVNDKLCFVGGYLNKILAWYTPVTDTWSKAADPLLQHQWGAALHQHNTIVILGGYEQKKVEVYNMDTGVWSVCDYEVPKPLLNLRGFKFD